MSESSRCHEYGLSSPHAALPEVSTTPGELARFGGHHWSSAYLPQRDAIPDHVLPSRTSSWHLSCDLHASAPLLPESLLRGVWRTWRTTASQLATLAKEEEGPAGDQDPRLIRDSCNLSPNAPHSLVETRSSLDQSVPNQACHRREKANEGERLSFLLPYCTLCPWLPVPFGATSKYSDLVPQGPGVKRRTNRKTGLDTSIVVRHEV